MQAVALECMRGAHRQQRACYLYAFSGPGDVQELELTTSAPSLTQLLAFLRNRRASPTRHLALCRAQALAQGYASSHKVMPARTRLCQLACAARAAC